MHGFLNFSLWIPIALAKIYFFRRGPNLAKKTVFSRHRPFDVNF